MRRFARAATADKELADRCVAQAIQHLIASVEEEEKVSLPDHVKLYRAVEHVLQQEAGGSFEKRAWRALILVFVEELSPFEAGWILGVKAGKIKELVASAEKHVKGALSNDCP
ncbi:MAG: hypothetical protein AAFN91_16215 [Pseudomonadota bacterium]